MSPVTKIKQLTAMAAVGLLALAVGATPAVAAEGVYEIEPGSFIAKTHDPVSEVIGYGAITPGNPSKLRNAVVAMPEVSQAGAHPDATTVFNLVNSAEIPNKVIYVDAPPGFMGNAEAIPACRLEIFMRDRLGECSPLSQVGIMTTDADTVPIFKLPPPKDAPARFGFRTGHGETIYLTARVRSDGDYGLRVESVDLPTPYMGFFIVTQIWGVPYDPVHDAQRYGTLPNLPPEQIKPLLTNPTYCDSGRLATTVNVQPWKDPNFWLRDIAFSETQPTGCDLLEFGSVRAPVSLDFELDSSRGAAPAGLTAKLRLPYSEGLHGLGRPALRDTVVELPEGLVINPSAGDGLTACSQAEVRWERPGKADCPSSSKLGTAKVVTPVLSGPLDGEVFVAQPHENPLGAFIAMYVVVRGFGVEAKVVGEVRRDPVTGELTAVFRDNPQVPFTELDLRFKSGPRASLVSPDSCGTHKSVSRLKPWSFPHSGPEVVWPSRFVIDRGPDGGACLPEKRRFVPRVEAGVSKARAGGSSSFALRISRDDGDEEIKSVQSVQMPEGLLGRVAAVSLCGDQQAAAGACPEESRIGRVEVAAGAGTSPLWVPQAGKEPTGVYLTEPYRGAPYGLSIKVPAQAGPFDLGEVVVRSALHVDRRTARISAGVDETRLIDADGNLTEVLEGDLPRILDGIVLNQREIRVHVDKEGFMQNPTSCAPKQVKAGIVPIEGETVSLSSPFQVGDCAALPFKPRLALRLTGRKQTTTGKHPGIRAQVNQTGIGEAGIRKAKVTLPKSLALDVNNAQALCEFEDGIKDDLENHCPKGSIVGRVQAVSPLLKQPLTGNVYFVKNVRRDAKTGNAIRTLPMIIAALRGEVAINLRGESDTTRAGRLVNTFDQTPDAPITRFNLDINGGNNGIIAVTRTRAANINLCAKPSGHIADADMDGQNGRRYDRDIRMKTPCSKKQIKAAKRQAKRAAAKASRG